jgi:AraC-like DNA-binding protein
LKLPGIKSNRNARNITDELLQAELEADFALLRKAQAVNVLQIELKLRSEVIYTYWTYFKNYELALEQCDTLYMMLKDISHDDIPEKPIYSLQIADVYYFFKDYPKAISYYEEILKEKENVRYQWYVQGARNNLGLCYRYGFNALDRSDSCFRAILQTKYIRPNDEAGRYNWDGIAEGNIGYNMFLRKDYEQAIPLLKSSLSKMLKFGDYSYAMGTAISLSTIYLEKGNPAESGRYINLANDCYHKQPLKESKTRLYEVMSKYYSVTGNSRLTVVYMDSMLTENKRLEDEFNALQIVRVEQRKHLSEQKLIEGQLFVEKIRSERNRRILTIVVTGSALLGLVLLLYLILYNKKRAAYRELVRLSQEWAQTTNEQRTLSGHDTGENIKTGNKKTGTEELITKTDVVLFEQLEKFLHAEQVYAEPTITIDDLADRMKVNKTYLSRAINRCSKKHFNTYINEFRIKEAIRLLSNDSNRYTLEGIGFEVGFEERRSFYNAFKKTTGLSPSDFRKNLQKN